MRNKLLFHFSLLIFILFSKLAQAQLNAFSLSVVVQNETCTGNGTLQFELTDTTPGATVTFSVYALPNTTQPVVTTTQLSVTGLTAGTYQTVALQTLGNASNSQQTTVTLTDERTVLSYQILGQQVNCFNADVTVEVTAGQPVSYEIISGPVTYPPQPSNQFFNLPPGTYLFRVNDNCNDAIVQTYTVFYENPPNVAVVSLVLDCELTTCALGAGTLTLATDDSNLPLRYPLTLAFTAQAPNQSAISWTQTVASGGPLTVAVPVQMPLFNTSSSTYTVVITDACGNIRTFGPINYNSQPTVSVTSFKNNCFAALQVNPCLFLPPYTLNFTQAPPGFNPAQLSPQYPGPYQDSTVTFEATPTSAIPNGNYTLEFTDSCNRTITYTFTVSDPPMTYNLGYEPSLCSWVLTLPINGDPVVSVIFTEAPPEYAPQLPLDASGGIVGGVFEDELPPGNYEITVVDSCGITSQLTFVVGAPPVDVELVPGNPNGCIGNLGSIGIGIRFSQFQSIVMTEAPANFSFPTPYDCTPFIVQPTAVYAFVQNLPVGTYTFSITDVCGRVFVRSVTLVPQINTNALIKQELTGCGFGFSSIALRSLNGDLVSSQITAAPPGYPFPLPHNVTANIFNGRLYLNGLPAGTYTIASVDVCNVQLEEEYTLQGYQVTQNTIDFIPNCGSFNVRLFYTDNNLSNHVFYLQKWNPTLGQWTHPGTGVPQVSGAIPNSSNGIPLFQGMNLNFAYIGQFRVVEVFYYFSNGSPTLATCVTTLKEGSFFGDLKIINAYNVPCADTPRVVIVAQGAAPLYYSITSFNGQPFTLVNGTSNIFTGLQPGVYNFRVQDECGNIVNRLVNLGSLNPPAITAENLCEGQFGQLAVDANALFTYQWWNANNPNQILSTSAVLQFNPFFNAVHAGTYFVRITYAFAGTGCPDQVLQYVIPPSTLPFAGDDGIVSLCTPTLTLDLFTVLSGSYQPFGIWTDVTGSGGLNGSVWSTQGLPFGSYTFEYRVDGLCNTFDTAMVVVQFFEPLPELNITADLALCTGSQLELSAPIIPGASYVWVGPNGFTSSSASPPPFAATLEAAGTYELTVQRNTCVATASTSVAVTPLPEFTIVSTCVNGAVHLEVLPQTPSNLDNAALTWTGPGGFQATTATVDLTGQAAGTYTAAVTVEGLCTTAVSFDVLNTFCAFPNVLTPNDDGNNDSFNLTGWDVDRFEVYNRWGRRVYAERNYLNSWRGQNESGGLLPDGVYYYLVFLRNGIEKQGWVLLTSGR